MGNNCITLTPAEQKIADAILKKYPEACKRSGFTPSMCCEWIGGYITDNNKPLDFRPDEKTLVDWVERKRNQSGKSFLYIPYSIEYTPKGKTRQTYTVIDKKIFNKKGKEVFPEDSKDRRKIYANLAVQQGRAVVVRYKDKGYVVNNRNQIISETTGDMMQWGNENGDRREVLRLAKNIFEQKKKATAASSSNIQEAIDNNNNKKALDIIDEAIRTGNWSGEALDELENLNIEDYVKLLKRFSQEELRSSNETLREAEAIIARGSRGSDTSNSQGNRERAEQQIESWAKENGLFKAQNTPSYYEGKVTPDANTVFVFGSNPHGIHGAGAAAIAASQFGAQKGVGEGVTGNAYALPTKDLDKVKGTRWYRPGPKEEADVKEWYKTHEYSEVNNHPLNAERSITPQQIIESIKKLYDVARQNPDKQFKVNHYPLGQISLNGYLGEEMREMFIQAGEIPSNVVFNKEWVDSWPKIFQNTSGIKTADDIFKLLKNKYAPNSSEAKLVDMVFNTLRNINIRFVEANLDVAGKFSASNNTIYYDPSHLQGNTLLHEAIHAVTSYYLNAENTSDFPKEVKIAIQEIKECYRLLREDFEKEVGSKVTSIDLAFADSYGLTNEKEMVAELSNPEFIKRIRKFDAKNKGKNIFKRLIDAIFSLFNTNKSYTSVEKTVKDALVTLLTNPSKELAERYRLENANIKENIKALKNSNHVEVDRNAAIIKFLNTLPEDFNEDWLDTELRIDPGSLEYFTYSKGIDENTALRNAKDGTIFVYNDSLFFTLNGRPKREGEDIVIPVRVFNSKGLILNKLDIKRDSNGLDYISNIDPIFKTEVQIENVKKNLLSSIQENTLSEIDALYEDNKVVTTPDGINIPVTPGIKIKYPDAIGGYTFEITELLDNGDITYIRGKHYDRNGAFSHVEEVSEGTFGGVKGLKVYAPDGTDITNYHSRSNTINSNNDRYDNSEIEQIITVAPYFRNHLTSQNRESLEKATEKVREKAQKLASTMGLQIEAVEVVGGTYLENSEITYQYRIKSSDEEKIDLFASLMGDLSNEYQDAVIAANYVKKGEENSYEVVLSKPNARVEDIEADLKKKGIDGSTYHFDNGKLTFFVDLFKYTDNGPVLKNNEEIESEINNIKSLNEYGYRYESRQEQNSRYLDNESRQERYRDYLELGEGKETGTRIAQGLPTREQDRQLYNACQKALAICEAAAQYPDVEDPEKHPQEQKRQEQLRLQAAQKAEREWKSSIPSPTPSPSPSAAALTGASEASPLASGAAGFSFSQEEIAKAQKRQEEANKPLPEKHKSLGYDSAIDVKDDRETRFYRTFSPQQIKDRGALISDIFSSQLDDIVLDMIDEQLDIVDSEDSTEAEKNAAKQRINTLRDPVNGRQLAAQEVEDNGKKGLEVILDRIKEELERDMKYATEELKPLWQNTIDYFNELFNTQASLDIEEREGIRIIGLSIAEKNTSEESNDDNDDGDDDIGHIVSGSDGWSFQVRYTNPFDSLSRRVRSMLYEIEKPRTETDDLGQTKKYPMGQIYASLLSYLARNMQSPDDFLIIDRSYEGQDRWGNDIIESTYPNGYPTFPVLEKMKAIYPWVQQIIDRLTDDYIRPDWNASYRYPSTGGSMASQFYTNFRKAFIPYGKIQLGDGKFGVTPLNYEMDSRVQYDKLVANFNNRMVLTEHSIYDTSGRINRKNALWLKTNLRIASSILKEEEYYENPELTDEEDIRKYNDFIDLARTIIQSYGIDATQESVVSYMMMNDGEGLFRIFDDLSSLTYNILKVKEENLDSFNYIVDTRDNSGTPLWKHFFDDKGLISDASYMQSFYDAASQKTKYSYSADNYLMKTFRGVTMGTQQDRQAFIEEKFGKFEWFRNQKTKEWRNKWLEYWYNYDLEVKTLPYKNIDNVTEYTENDVRVRPYNKWTESDIWQVQNRSYGDDNYRKATAFYLAPIFSDSPMSMTVMGPKMNMNELLYGYTENGQHTQGALVHLVNQELKRIGYVQERAKAIEEGRVKPIANFDSGRGLKFCFISELNDYVFEDTGERFIDRMMRLKNEGATLAAIEESEIKAVKDILDGRMREYKEENNEQYTSKDTENTLRESYYNMVYANAAIIQLTTVDLAYYKNDTDFQKRFKEVYAGGIQLNTNSKYGKKTENVLLLADDIITSPSYDKIAAIIDGSGSLSAKDKKRIKETFTKINVADAQALRSMHSFRSVLDMMGNWTNEMEHALNHFRQGEWSREDFDIIYQTIKPFVYSVIERNDGFGNSILVPQQHKNSELCALMMYDLIVNDLGNSPVYKALSRFMEDTVDGDGNHLVDMIQFESAGKVGNQGVINISFNPNKVVDFLENVPAIGNRELEFTTLWDKNKNNYLPNNIENAEKNYKEIKRRADYYLTNGMMTQKEYDKLMQSFRPTEGEIISILEQAALVTNPDGTKSINAEIVHTIPFDNYYQQQPTPEHHLDTEATFGSQARNINVADLPADFELTVTGYKGKKHIFKGSDAVIDFYYELLNENLLEDFFGVGKKKGLKGIFSDKESLRDAVLEIVRGNPKYGQDFVDALQIDANGDFVLNPNSPTIFHLMQEIVTSFFKNRITKQTINGAALIQAAGIGLDENLRLEFSEDGRCIGAHCLMPLTSKKFFEPFLETQTINGKEVKVLNVEKLKEAGLDKAIGYRIPTENKSSMMPLIIDGFTPLQNGSAIILPAEITNLSGSDFDVDKMFIMLLSFNLITEDKKRAFNDYVAEGHRDDQEVIDALGHANIEDLEIEELGQNFNEWYEERKEEYQLETPIIKKVEYDFRKTPKQNGRKARNNMLIQMMFGILTSKAGSESLLNPQGFPDVKHAAKIVRILTDKQLRRQLIANTNEVGPGVMPSSDRIAAEFLDIVQKRFPNEYEEYKKALLNMSAEQIQQAYIQAITAGGNQKAVDLLLNSSTKELERFIATYSAPESPVYPQTFAHSHARNMAGANQIGIYAIQCSMAAKYQRASERLREEQQFTINGRLIRDVDISEEGRRLKNGGQMVGASADNGKDPNLSDMGSTTKTSPMIGYMLRAGLSHLEAALLINQPFMSKSKYSAHNGYWDDILGKNRLAITPGNITTDMLIKNLISPFELTIEEKQSIAGVCYRILMQHEAQEYMTQISRADSPNGSMKNTYAKARIQRYKVDLFQAKMGQPNFPFVRINEALSNTAIDTAASEDVIREQLKAQPMAFLHGMYALGINSFNNLVSPYFFGAQQWFDDDIVKPILYNLREGLSDEDKERIVDNIYNSYITYMLSSSRLFGNEDGNSMKDKRAYYLEAFPNDYIKIIQENEDIRTLLGNILQVQQFGSRKRVVLQDVGSLSKGQKLDVERRFEMLFYSENPVAKDLAKDLLIYSYFDNGLQFTHDSFSHLFTTRFLTHFREYNGTLKELDHEITAEEKKNYIAQFLLTYNEACYNVNSVLTGDEGYAIWPDSIVVDLNNRKMRRSMINEVMSPNPHYEGINVYPYITYNGNVYILDKDRFDEDSAHPLYNKVSGYQTFPKLPLFSRQMSVVQMAQEFPVDAEQRKAEELPSLGEDAALTAPNEGYGNPEVGPDSMYDNFNQMDSFTPDFDPSDLAGIQDVTPSDTYQSEGKGSLEKPFC